MLLIMLKVLEVVTVGRLGASFSAKDLYLPVRGSFRSWSSAKLYSPALEPERTI